MKLQHVKKYERFGSGLCFNNVLLQKIHKYLFQIDLGEFVQLSTMN